MLVECLHMLESQYRFDSPHSRVSYDVVFNIVDSSAVDLSSQRLLKEMGTAFLRTSTPNPSSKPNVHDSFLRATWQLPEEALQDHCPRTMKTGPSKMYGNSIPIQCLSC